MAHPAPRVNVELQERLGDAPLERILRCLHPVELAGPVEDVDHGQ